MTTIGIILGSTRPGRRGEQVSRWVHEVASTRSDATYLHIDLADHDLPLLDEPSPPARRAYEHVHTKKWSATIEPCDGFVFVTPEYNHSTSGALKNAIDFLYHEWANKAAGFVSYGSAGGVRAVEHLRLIAGELQLADVRQHVVLSLQADFENYTTFTPNERNVKSVHTMLDQVVAWSTALAPLRSAS